MQQFVAAAGGDWPAVLSKRRAIQHEWLCLASALGKTQCQAFWSGAKAWGRVRADRTVEMSLQTIVLPSNQHRVFLQRLAGEQEYRLGVLSPLDQPTRAAVSPRVWYEPQASAIRTVQAVVCRSRRARWDCRRCILYFVLNCRWRWWAASRWERTSEMVCALGGRALFGVISLPASIVFGCIVDVLTGLVHSSCFGCAVASLAVADTVVIPALRAQSRLQRPFETRSPWLLHPTRRCGSTPPSPLAPPTLSRPPRG